jgi:drug/metabolite transporter (DMT)-like permease
VTPSLVERTLGLRPEVKAILLTLVAMGMFGSMDGFSKALVQHYPAWLVLWLRHLVALPLVILILAPRHPLRTLRATRRPGLQVLRTLLLVVEMGLVLIAFRTMPLADAHAILAATPLVVTALSVPLLQERVGWRRWLAVGIAFTGVLLIVRPGLTAIQPAALIAILCTVMYACYQILTRLAARTDPADTSYLVQTALATCFLSLVGPFFWMPIEPRHLPAILALGVLGAAGHYCLVRALTMAAAVVVQPFTYTMLVWAVVIGYLVFGDLPDAWTIAGAALVVSAGIYAAWREHQRGRAAAARP